MEQNSTFDLVVLGCGAAGLSAALGFIEAASESGPSPSVAIVERSSKENRGGATRGSWAALMVTTEGIVDPVVIERVINSHPDVDESYFRALEAGAGESVRWLDKHGVSVAHEPSGFAMESTYGNVVGGGLAIVDAFAAAVEEYPAATFFYETEAVRLSLDEAGRVNGLIVRGADGLLRTLSAAKVVIASGGFEGSNEMLTRYVGPRAHEIVPVVPSIKGNVGDGLRMITEIGGSTAGQFDMLHVQLIDERSTKPDAGIFGVPYGIIVDQAAERFIDEGSRTFEGLNEPLAWKVWRDHNNTAYFIFDAQALAIPGFQFLNQTDVDPVEAATIHELGSKLGLDGAKLDEAVSEFNAAVQDGDFDQTQRDKKHTSGLAIEKTNWARTISEAPFQAFPVKTAVTFSFGGVRTDIRARVVTPNGTPIPNLYAAGVVTGVWYDEYPGALSVLRSVTFGRIAGREAAEGIQA